ncbi:hypothetical protein [Methylocystis parvus]|uniref:hypothetical protein n=1 Tax=Methylocystis parvus TaxID=134 RepID=UPI003C71F76E
MLTDPALRERMAQQVDLHIARPERGECLVTIWDKTQIQRCCFVYHAAAATSRLDKRASCDHGEGNSLIAAATRRGVRNAAGDNARE